MRPRQVSYELLQAVEAQRAEATGKRVVGRCYDTSVDGAQVLEEMRFLLEHSDAETTGEGLFTGVNSQMSLEIPRHAELLAAVGATVLPDGIRLWWILGGRRRRSSRGRQRPRTPWRLQTRCRCWIGARRPVRTSGWRHRPVLL